MKDLKILHLAHDGKFIDQAVNAFEREAPGCNDLLVCAQEPLKYVKSEAVLINKIRDVNCVISRFSGSHQIVVVHSLNPVWFKAIASLRSSATIVWLGWGYDYYDLISKDREGLFLPLTSKVVKFSKKKKKLSARIKSFLMKVINPSKGATIEMVDIFCPVLSSEYDHVKRRFGGKSFPAQGFWNYGNLEDDLIQGFEGQVVSGKNILVGNSASPNNNHLDAFSLLAELRISEQKIVTPLSYGDAGYRALVIREGVDSFGDGFRPLIDYLPIQEYVKILQSCGFAIMNHLRQQGLGNIVIMLYLGAKVFLDKSCPTFKYFKEQGAVIFSTDELKDNPGMLNELLDEEKVFLNRKVLEANWSREISGRKTRELLRIATSITKLN